MTSIVIPELIILLVIVVLLFGPDRIGRGIRGLSKSLLGTRQTTVRQEPIEDKDNKNN